ncbi:hypothetical protein H0H87_012777 [Tephrocybe sp. NHM501043]|nr:hypothetical protein H0H87_012777 [Tephrocybe sp. NHM501043]
MHEVAQHSNVLAAIEPTIQIPQGNSIKLHNVQVFNGKHGLNLKDGIPMEWFNQLKQSGSSLLYNWNNFIAAFCKKFVDPSLIKNADNCLDMLKQSGFAQSYLTSFMETAAYLDMMEETKIFCFMKGLKPAVKDGLVPIVDCLQTLKAWKSIISLINSNLHQCKIEHQHEGKTSTSSKKPVPLNLLPLSVL